MPDLSVHKQHTVTVWLTGLSGAGKSTLAEGLYQGLTENRCPACILDGDNLRKGLNRDLGYSEADRMENIRRVAELSKLLNNQGITCINAFISPTNIIRDKAKEIIGADRFFLVYVNAPIEICEKRDKKGLYEKARKGEIKDFTGISSPFEAPSNMDFEIDTVNKTVEEGVVLLYNIVLKNLKING